MTTYWNRLDLSHANAVPVNPNLDWRRRSSRVWSIVSNAALRSNSTNSHFLVIHVHKNVITNLNKSGLSAMPFAIRRWGLRTRILVLIFGQLLLGFIFCLRHRIEKLLNSLADYLVIVFLDLKSAFNSFLRKCGTPSCVWLI